MEDALICAKRELEEETGYVSDKWTHLITIPSNATVADNYAHWPETAGRSPGRAWMKQRTWRQSC